MGIFAGTNNFRRYGYGIELPDGFLPVAIPSSDGVARGAVCSVWLLAGEKKESDGWIDPRHAGINKGSPDRP